jgi:hypothetical protein
VRRQVRNPVRGDTRAAAIAVIVLVALLICAGWRASAGDFDSGKASFPVKFADEVTPYRVTGVFVLPGERLEIEVPADEALYACGLNAEAGRIVEGGRNKWTWEAPQEPGEVYLVVYSPELGDSVVLNVFVMIPFENIKGDSLNGYCIGEYPSIPLEQPAVCESPKGFIEVTEDNLCTLVGPHFQLGQFICKQNGGYPKYLVLRERLILKLELILERLNAAGYRYDTFHVMSGYRTPHYNRAIGNVEYSRHLWGGAADIFVDGAPLDGMMDDLNGDGRIDYRDAEVVYDIIDRMYGKPWYERFLGGLARYKKTSSHGPFVHVDVRGTRARWGT